MREGPCRRWITFGGEAFNRPAMWLGDRLQVVWLGVPRWRTWHFWRVRMPELADVWRWVLYLGPLEIRWWVPRPPPAPPCPHWPPHRQVMTGEGNTVYCRTCGALLEDSK